MHLNDLVLGKCYLVNLPVEYMVAFNFYNEPFILLSKENNNFIKILYKGKVDFMPIYDWVIFSECNII